MDAIMMQHNSLRYVKRELKLMTIDRVHDNSPLLSYPTVFVGTSDECSDYAKLGNFEWKNNNMMLFGGYFVNNETGDCLFPM